MSAPVVFPYQQALDEFRREGREAPLLKRMSELISLLDLSTTLGASGSAAGILDSALLVVMGELQVSRGALFVRSPKAAGSPEAREAPANAFTRQATRGFGGREPPRLELAGRLPSEPVMRGSPQWAQEWSAAPFEVIAPVWRGEKAVGLLALGPRAEGRPYGPEQLAFLRSMAACSATAIENGLMNEELRSVNQELSRKVFELKNLFDLSRELTGSFDPDAIRRLFVTTVMGQLMVSRAALYLGGPGELYCAHERGAKSEAGAPVPVAQARLALATLDHPRATAELPDGPFRERLLRSGLAFLFPLSVGNRLEGLLAVGERARPAPFSESDHDFVRTLGRQALAALESVRLHLVEVEKQRQDREMQIARDIQQSLFPASCPELPGFELAARSEPCYQVGGDHYDFIPLGNGRLALAVADVSGKGTPASILMASVHASLRALAGTARPGRLFDRLNRFLFESTQANKYVTLFYAELEPSTGRLCYVNGGHVPPYHVALSGTVSRLGAGGPVLGLLENVAYEEGEVSLERGDVVAVVTDGATEAASASGEELGDGGVCRVLGESLRLPAARQLERLLTAVHAWTGERGCSDDLTALVLRDAREP